MNKNPGTFINFFAGISELKDIPSTRMEAVLINVPQIIKNSKSADKTKTIVRKTGAKYSMLDSGGFTIFNTYQKNGDLRIDGSNVLVRNNHKEIAFSSYSVIEAALHTQPDILIGLDYPIIKTRDPIIREKEFHEKKAINLQWMREISNLRQIHCPHIELYLPIQCYDLDQFSYLEGELVSLDFDGIALPTRNMPPVEISRFLIRAHELGIRKVHLLGTSSFSNIALATYFASNFFERCSVDSTTWRNASQYHDYIHPASLLSVCVGRNSTVDHREKLACRCKLCRGNTFGTIIDLEDKNRRVSLLRHNYLVMKKAGDDLFKHALDSQIFEQYLRKRAPNREKDIDLVMRAIKIADSHKKFARKERRWRAA